MTKCLRCEMEKPADAFSVDRSRESGLSRYCKACVKTHYSRAKPEGWARKTADMRAYGREKERLYRQRHPERMREIGRRKYVAKMLRETPDWKPHVAKTAEELAAAKRERVREKNADRKSKRQSDPQEMLKHRARHMLQKRVARGSVVPLACFICGEKAEAHHVSYDLPLDVAWLCPQHHREAHALTDELKAIDSAR